MTEREFSAGGLWWRVYGVGTEETVERVEIPSPPGGSEPLSPLVILHGLFGSGDNWRTQAIALAEDRIVFVCDMPDHGRSSHWNTFAYREVADLLWVAVSAVLRELDIPEIPVVLMGHSMGGKAAMAMAIGNPDRCERLVVADIAPRIYPPRHDEIFDAMTAVADAGVESRGEADRIMAENIRQKAIRMFLLKSLVPGGDRGAAGTPADRYGWRLNLSGLREGYGEIRSWPETAPSDHYPGPTLLIRGGASPYVSDEDAPAIHRLFPQVSFHTIDRVGHWLHAEARDEFVSVVRTFIS